MLVDTAGMFARRVAYAYGN